MCSRVSWDNKAPCRVAGPGIFLIIIVITFLLEVLRKKTGKPSNVFLLQTRVHGFLAPQKRQNRANIPHPNKRTIFFPASEASGSLQSLCTEAVVAVDKTCPRLFSIGFEHG